MCCSCGPPRYDTVSLPYWFTLRFLLLFSSSSLPLLFLFSSSSLPLLFLFSPIHHLCGLGWCVLCVVALLTTAITVMPQDDTRTLRLLAGSGGSAVGVTRTWEAVSGKDGSLTSLMELCVGAVSIPRPLCAASTPAAATVLHGGSGRGGGKTPTRVPHSHSRSCHQSACPQPLFDVLPALGDAVTMKVQRRDGTSQQALHQVEVRRCGDTQRMCAGVGVVGARYMREVRAQVGLILVVDAQAPRKPIKFKKMTSSVAQVQAQQPHFALVSISNSPAGSKSTAGFDNAPTLPRLVVRVGKNMHTYACVCVCVFVCVCVCVCVCLIRQLALG